LPLDFYENKRKNTDIATVVTLTVDLFGLKMAVPVQFDVVTFSPR